MKITTLDGYAETFATFLQREKIPYTQVRTKLEASDLFWTTFTIPDEQAQWLITCLVIEYHRAKTQPEIFKILNQ